MGRRPPGSRCRGAPPCPAGRPPRAARPAPGGGGGGDTRQHIVSSVCHNAPSWPTTSCSAPSTWGLGTGHCDEAPPRAKADTPGWPPAGQPWLWSTGRSMQGRKHLPAAAHCAQVPGTHLPTVHHRLVVHCHQVCDDRRRHTRLPRWAAQADVGGCRVSGGMWGATHGDSMRRHASPGSAECRQPAGQPQAPAQRPGTISRTRCWCGCTPKRTCVCCCTEGCRMLGLHKAAAPAGQVVPAERGRIQGGYNGPRPCARSRPFLEQEL